MEMDDEQTISETFMIGHSDTELLLRSSAPLELQFILPKDRVIRTEYDAVSSCLQ